MSETNMVEAVSVLRDEVLATADHGDRDPPGAEVFDALIRALASADSLSGFSGIDLALHDSVSRRLAWGHSEELVLADAELIFDRVMIAVERAFRDPADQMVVIEAVTQVAVTVARVASLEAIARAARDRAARIREEMAQRQLREVLDKQHGAVARLEHDLKQDFR